MEHVHHGAGAGRAGNVRFFAGVQVDVTVYTREEGEKDPTSLDLVKERQGQGRELVRSTDEGVLEADGERFVGRRG